MALGGLEVHRLVVPGRALVAGGQDATGPRVDLGPVALGAIEPFVDDLERVARLHGALEVDVPREHVGEVAGELAVLAQRHDCPVERRGHDAGESDRTRHHRGLLASDPPVFAVPHHEVAARLGGPVTEVDQLPGLVAGKAVAVARSGLPEVEVLGHGSSDQVDRLGGDPVAPQRRGQGGAVLQRARADLHCGGLRRRGLGLGRGLDPQLG
jgi:hypothetical protein